MLVSPTEPKELREQGKVSLVPERYGVDYLFLSPHIGMAGVQRKEIKDLIASVHDGRLAKELGQMRALGLAMVVVEGRTQWSNDGLLMSNYGSWTIAQHLGVLWSIQLNGCWITNTMSVAETQRLLSLFGRWITKQRHASLTHRPNPSGEWGTAESRDWGIHLLQSFKGIGPEVAAAIFDHFGRVPLTWAVGELDLMEVRGVGKGRAAELVKSLGTTDIDWSGKG